MWGLTLRGVRLELSRGFLALLALLLWLDGEQGVLLCALLACSIHELGHLCAIWAAGASVKCFRITAVGAELVIRDSAAVSYGKELLIALGGPAGSLLGAFLAARLGRFLLAGICLGQGLFNLLPAAPLDGGRSLGALVAMVWGPDRAEAVLSVCSAVITGVLLGLGLLLLERFFDLTLLLVALWLLTGLLRQGRSSEKRVQIGKEK